MKLNKNNKLDKHTFDDQFKTKFEGFAPTVIPELWSKIENELDEKSETPVLLGQSIFTRFLKYGAVAATILIAFAIWKWNDAEVVYLKKAPEALLSELPQESPMLSSKEKTEHSPIQTGDGNPVQAILENQNEERKLVIETTDKKEKTNKAIISLQEDIIGDNQYAIVETLAPNSSTVSLSQTTIELEEHIEPGKLTLTLQESSNTNAIAANRGSEMANLSPRRAEIEDDEDLGNPRKRKLGISTVLNFLAKGISGSGEPSIQFSESEEGILKLDVKQGLAKTKN